MRIILFCLPVLLFITGCSDNADEATAENTETPAVVQSQPPPPELDNKFDKILGEFEQKISNSFWTTFTSTTRRGGEGTTEIAFDENAYEKYMKKKGLMPIPNVSKGFSGKVDDIDITISEKTFSGENGGWFLKFTILVKDSSDKGIFTKQREFVANKE